MGGDKAASRISANNADFTTEGTINPEREETKLAAQQEEGDYRDEPDCRSSGVKEQSVLEKNTLSSW